MMSKSFKLTLVLLTSLPFASLSQVDADKVINGFKHYQNTFSKNHVTLVLNQYKFAPGDTIFFKVYYLSDSLSLLNGKHLVNVDLVNARSESITRVVVRVTNGLAFNQLVIPENLPAGYFSLAAYPSGQPAERSNAFRANLSIVQKNKVKAESKIEITILSGDLVVGLPSLLSVETEQNETIILEDQSGIEVIKKNVTVGTLEMLTFTPQPDHSYFIRNGNQTMSLPKPKGDGITMQITQSNDSVHIKFLLRENSIYRNKNFLLVSYSRSKILFVKQVNVSSGLRLLIEKEKLESGYVHFDLLSENWDTNANSIILVDPKNPLTADISANKDKYLTREKVRLSVQVSSKNISEFSIAVTPKKLLLGNTQSFSKEIWSTLDQSLCQTQSLENPNRMILSSICGIDWQQVAQKKAGTPLNFSVPLKFRGTAYYSDSVTTLPQGTTLVCYFQGTKERYQTSVSSNGEFVLNTLDFYGQMPVLFIAEYKKNDVPIDVENPVVKWNTQSLVSPMPARHSIETNEFDPFGEFSSTNKIISKSYSVFESDATLSLENQKIDLVDADIAVDLTSYVSFNSTKELIKEVIPSLFVRRFKKKDVVRVELPLPLEANGSPLFIIDGVATTNSDIFLSLKPSDLKSIKVVYQPKKLIPLGLLGKNGIVYVESKKHNMGKLLVGQKIFLEGLSKPFVVNNKINKNSLAPQYRSTIFWEPILKTDENGKAEIEFELTDDTGPMEISIKGICNRQPFSTTKDILVTPRLKD